MHALVGNTASLRCETFNINGVNTAGKLQSVVQDMGDILVLTETHASVHVQKGYEESLKHVHFAWAGSQTQAGVAIVARKSTLSDFETLTFDDGPLKILNHEGRFVALPNFCRQWQNQFYCPRILWVCWCALGSAVAAQKQ